MRIRPDVLQEVRTRLVDAYPLEGCGFLLGMRRSDRVIVSRVQPVDNHRAVDGAAHHRYLITPDDYRGAERRAREAGLEIVGTYHSHPDVPARPSAFDRDHAWPSFRYLIVAVYAGQVRDERVWELRGDRTDFIEHLLRIEEN